MKPLLPILCLLPAPSFAAFVLIDNFDSGYTLGALAGQNGWSNTTGGWSVAAAPAGGVGNVASGASVLTPNNNFASKQLSLAIANTSTSSTLFFRVRRTGGGVNMSVGLSDVLVPAATGDYETQINAQHNTTAVDTFKVRDAGAFDDLGTGTFAIDTWYNVWMIVNNSADTYEMWIDQGNFGAPGTALTHILDPVGGGPGDFTFGFRNGTAANALTSVFLSMGGTNPILSGSLLVDDLYIDSFGQNLSNPTAVPEPSSAVAVVGGAACLLGLLSRRRRG